MSWIEEMRIESEKEYRERAIKSFEANFARPENRRPENRMYRQRGDGAIVPNISTCYKCGASDHKQRNCPNNAPTCFNCQNVGHIRSQCTFPDNGKGKSMVTGKSKGPTLLQRLEAQRASYESAQNEVIQSVTQYLEKENPTIEDESKIAAVSSETDENEDDRQKRYHELLRKERQKRLELKFWKDLVTTKIEECDKYIDELLNCLENQLPCKSNVSVQRHNNAVHARVIESMNNLKPASASTSTPIFQTRANIAKSVSFDADTKPPSNVMSTKVLPLKKTKPVSKIVEEANRIWSLAADVPHATNSPDPEAWEETVEMGPRRNVNELLLVNPLDLQPVSTLPTPTPTNITANSINEILQAEKAYIAEIWKQKQIEGKIDVMHDEQNVITAIDDVMKIEADNDIISLEKCQAYIGTFKHLERIGRRSGFMLSEKARDMFAMLLFDVVTPLRKNE